MNRKSKLSNYFYTTDEIIFIDAGPMGNHTRFINHSCKENCRAVGSAGYEITIKAVKAIEAGEELLLNYGEEYFKDLKCLCGEDNCLNNINTLKGYFYKCSELNYPN